MSAFQKIIFALIAIVAFVGLIMNLDTFLLSITNTIITMLVVVGVIYALYFFFFLTEDQRKYKKAVWKNKWKYRRRK
ncbi:membrane protein [Staphylococcus microti]|uniref:Exported protein n=1 Tax=Staphylococcus microti TaxID=569857 RepID=A0A0D6XUQ1_9STAP|nr:SA1362 family protein [Staphylococcus microti]KIX91568.1 membrane protein [Staphylococcus microti]PNZ81025.1 hypothetical protein CD132_07095 [Staphylococcus microti]SUM57555.1 exported protein [Staphylococcus microti]